MQTTTGSPYNAQQEPQDLADGMTASGELSPFKKKLIASLCAKFAEMDISENLARRIKYFFEEHIGKGKEIPRIGAIEVFGFEVIISVLDDTIHGPIINQFAKEINCIANSILGGSTFGAGTFKAPNKMLAAMEKLETGLEMQLSKIAKRLPQEKGLQSAVLNELTQVANNSAKRIAAFTLRQCIADFNKTKATEIT